MTLRISAFTRTCLLLSVIPAAIGGCVAAASSGWNKSLANAVPVTPTAGFKGFATVFLGPLSWFLPWSARAPQVAALATVALLAMMLAHTLTGNALGRSLTRWGFILWSLCGFLALGAML